MVSITGTQAVSHRVTTGKTKKKSSATFQIGTAGATKETASLSVVSPVSPLKMVETSESVKPAETSFETFQARGTEALDHLDEVHKGFVVGDDPEAALKGLRELVDKFPNVEGDPELIQLKELIEIRMAVELAKRGRI